MRVETFEELSILSLLVDTAAQHVRNQRQDVDAEKGADQAIRELNGVRQQTFFREDLDAFESFVDERLEELNDRRAGEEHFPVDGLAGEPNYRRIDNRDLLLEGESDD